MSVKDRGMEVIEIDLLDLGYRLWEKIHHIVLCFLLGALILNAYSYFLIQPTYDSTARIYVVSSSTDSVVDLSDLNIGTSLTSDYEELIMSYSVLNRAIDELGMDISYDSFKEMIKIENPADTRILNVTATATDPELAQDIANKVAEVAVEYLPETMNTLAPNIAQKAQLPDHKSNPSYMKYTAMGGVLGALIYIIFLTVGYILDDTIHDPEEMEKYFDMVPLSSIGKNDSFL